MSEAVRKIIELARTQLGVTEDPPGSNNVLYNTEYYGRKINHPDYHWCAVFIWWLFHKQGLDSLYYGGKKTASCCVLYTWARQNKLTVTFDQAQPGDIALFDWNNNDSPDHVGLVIGRDGTGDLITIEGNVSDSVKQCQRKASQTCMVYRPEYPEDQDTGNYVTHDEMNRTLEGYLTRAQLAEILYKTISNL